MTPVPQSMFEGEDLDALTQKYLKAIDEDDAQLFAAMAMAEAETRVGEPAKTLDDVRYEVLHRIVKEIDGLSNEMNDTHLRASMEMEALILKKETGSPYAAALADLTRAVCLRKLKYAQRYRDAKLRQTTLIAGLSPEGDTQMWNLVTDAMIVALRESGLAERPNDKYVTLPDANSPKPDKEK